MNYQFAIFAAPLIKPQQQTAVAAKTSYQDNDIGEKTEQCTSGTE